MVEIFLGQIKSAFAQTKALLFPVRAGVWVKLVFLFMLAGTQGGSGGSSFPDFDHINKLRSLTHDHAAETATITNDPDSTDIDEIKSVSPKATSKRVFPAFDQWRRYKETAKLLWQENKTTIILVGVCFSITIALLIVLLTYVTSRLEFVLLKSFTKGQVHVRRFWKETEKFGLSLYKWNLAVFFGYVMPGVIIIAGAVIWLMLNGGFAQFNTNFISWILLILFVSIFISSIFLLAVIQPFLSPFMFIKKIYVLKAVSKFWNWGRQHFWRGVGYLIMYAITKMIIGVAVFLVVLILMIPLLLVAIFLGAAGKASGLGTMFMIFLVAMSVVAMVLIWLLTSVPINSFFVYLRLTMLGGGHSRIIKSVTSQSLSP